MRMRPLSLASPSLRPGRLVALVALVVLALLAYTYRRANDAPSNALAARPALDDAARRRLADFAAVDANGRLSAAEVKAELLAQHEAGAVQKKLADDERRQLRDAKRLHFEQLRDAASAQRNPWNISMSLVLGRLKSEEQLTAWTREVYGLDRIAEYIVDDPDAPLSLAHNKGREAAVYLKYIITHYDNLTDVTAFTHSSDFAWHNNVLLYKDLVPTLNRLRRSHVLYEGYFNLRCEHWPGCPRWIKFNTNRKTQLDYQDRALDAYTTAMWAKVFPGEPVPAFLAEPCCSQFAVSREAIQSVPKETYTRLLQWLLDEELEQYSGRQMEYIWQYLFRGQEEFCPSMSACYCNGYAICPEDPHQLVTYNNARKWDDEGWRNFEDGGAEMKSWAQMTMYELEELLPRTLGVDSPNTWPLAWDQGGSFAPFDYIPAEHVLQNMDSGYVGASESPAGSLPPLLDDQDGEQPPPPPPAGPPVNPDGFEDPALSAMAHEFNGVAGAPTDGAAGTNFESDKKSADQQAREWRLDQERLEQRLSEERRLALEREQRLKSGDKDAAPAEPPPEHHAYQGRVDDYRAVGRPKQSSNEEDLVNAKKALKDAIDAGTARVEDPISKTNNEPPIKPENGWDTPAASESDEPSIFTDGVQDFKAAAQQLEQKSYEELAQQGWKEMDPTPSKGDLPPADAAEQPAIFTEGVQDWKAAALELEQKMHDGMADPNAAAEEPADAKGADLKGADLKDAALRLDQKTREESRNPPPAADDREPFQGFAAPPR